MCHRLILDDVDEDEGSTPTLRLVMKGGVPVLPALSLRAWSVSEIRRRWLTRYVCFLNLH